MWLKQVYKPSKESKTVYFINHNMWWDGLLPLYLSRNIFHQKARAMMEDKQMKKYPFFSRIGVFSINLSDPKSSIYSLKFAIESMKRANSSLYIYPEGMLTTASESKPEFKKGLAWLYQKMGSEVDFVPVAFYSHTFRDSKPELYINIGSPVELDKALSKEDLTSKFEEAVHNLLLETRNVAGFGDQEFKKV